MSYKYIASEREYGSGGTKIARQLSAETGVACYGIEILEAVSKKLNVPVEQIEKYEETVSNSFLYTTFLISKAQEGNTDMLTKEGHIFVTEQQEIKLLADKGPAIFIGHCAAEALKNQKVLKVYIRSSNHAEKQRRIEEDYGVNPANVESVCKRYDNRRSKYYFANTAKKWDDLRNYDIVLDSAQLGIDACTAVLKSLMQQ